MRELIFSEKFALISLNGEDSIGMNIDKKTLLKCISAACIIELYLDNSFVFDEGILSVTEDDLKQYSINKYQKVVLDAILKKRQIINDKFIMCIKEVVSLKSKTLKDIENLYISTLGKINCIEKYSDGVVEIYHTKEELYINLINNLKDGVLGFNEISEENVFMMWLLRESGGLSNIFTTEELIIIESKIDNARYNNLLSSKTLKVNIQKNIKNRIKKVIKNNGDLHI